MPHIVVTHSGDLTAEVQDCLLKLSQDLESQGVSRAGIKCYTLPMGAAVNAGEAGASLVHINLRVMRKAGRTDRLITDWLKSLADILANNIKTPHTLTAEANFLPEIYISATA